MPPLVVGNWRCNESLAADRIINIEANRTISIHLQKVGIQPPARVSAPEDFL